MQLRKLRPCELSSFSDNLFVGETNALEGWIRPLWIVDDWAHEENWDVFLQYVRRGRPEDGNPMFDVFRSPFRLRVARRRDFVTDERWFGSAFYPSFDWQRPAHNSVAALRSSERRAEVSFSPLLEC